MTSLALPAENGTMTLIGLEAACWAWAGMLTPAAVSTILRQRPLHARPVCENDSS